MSIIKSAYLELVKVLSPVRHARMIGVDGWNLSVDCHL